MGQLEGRRPVLEALRGGRPVTEVLVAEGVRESGPIADILREASRRRVPVRRVPRATIDGRATTAVPQGVIAVVPGFRYADLGEVLSRASDRAEPLLAVACDGITDPHNVGAIARSAEAAGAHGLLLPRRRTAPVTPAVEKAAAGALSHVPVVQVDNLARVLERLRRDGVWTVALDGEGETSLYELELGSAPLVLVAGAEGRGVSRLVRERADVRVRIPLRGTVSSLNASVAAGVALFEVARRRATEGSRFVPED